MADGARAADGEGPKHTLHKGASRYDVSIRGEGGHVKVDIEREVA